MKRGIILVAALVAAGSFAISAKADVLFSQNFNTPGDTSGWSSGSGYGSITQVASGTNGITAAEGAGYAQVNSVAGSSGPYTHFDQAKGPYTGAYTASVEIYLDPTKWSVGSGFDWDVAPSNGAGSYGGPDYIFHTDETATGQLQIGASNNSTDAPPATVSTDPNATVVTTTGWYTFISSFTDNGGTLAATLTVTNSSNATVFSEAMSAPGVLAGVDYGWFNFADVGSDGLAIDDSTFTVVPLPASAWSGLFLLGGLGLLGGVKRLRKQMA